MPWKIKRSELDKMKKIFGMEDSSDRDFIEWWRRNQGTGYEAFEKLQIIEGQ